jgi:hypothetical protein
VCELIVYLYNDTVNDHTGGSDIKFNLKITDKNLTLQKIKKITQHKRFYILIPFFEMSVR